MVGSGTEVVHVSELSRRHIQEQIKHGGSTDVVILVSTSNHTGNTKIELLKGHRLLLAGWSPVLRDLISEAEKSGHPGWVSLTGIDPGPLQALLNVFYTGELVLDGCGVWATREVSNRLGVQPLVQLCDDYMIRNADPTNCVQWLMEANNYNARDLQDVFFQETVNSFNVIKNADDYLKLGGKLFLPILKQSHHQGHVSAFSLLTAALRWIEYDHESRKDLCPDILSRVDFKLAAKDEEQMMTSAIRFQSFLGTVCHDAVLQKNGVEIRTVKEMGSARERSREAIKSSECTPLRGDSPSEFGTQDPKLQQSSGDSQMDALATGDGPKDDVPKVDFDKVCIQDAMSIRSQKQNKQLDTIGSSSGCTDSDKPPDTPYYGVQSNLDISELKEAGWKVVFGKPCECQTWAEDLERLQGDYLLVGVARKGKTKLRLCAMGKRGSILRHTTAGETIYENGVYWHFRPDWSFGFSATDRLDQENTDTMVEIGEKTVRWQLAEGTACSGMLSPRSFSRDPQRLAGSCSGWLNLVFTLPSKLPSNNCPFCPWSVPRD